MSTQLRVALLIAGAFVVVVGGLLLWSGRDDAPDSASDASGSDSTGSAIDPRLVREDSRIMGEEGSSDVVMVEFLDFECEACGAAYPIIENLREKYAGQVTFVARYFPLPGHFNSERAARAVESAARQGKFDEMYQQMFETQIEWGEKQEPLDDLFREYAVEIGLDMEQYDADYASKEVADRVQRDREDGTDLGVGGTPTFYLNGELFEPNTVEDFDDAIDDALNE